MVKDSPEIQITELHLLLSHSLFSFVPVPWYIWWHAVHWWWLWQTRWVLELLNIISWRGFVEGTRQGQCVDHPKLIYYLPLLSPLIQVNTWDRQLLSVGSCVHMFVWDTWEECWVWIYTLTSLLCGVAAGYFSPGCASAAAAGNKLAISELISHWLHECVKMLTGTGEITISLCLCQHVYICWVTLIEVQICKHAAAL